MQQILCWR